jgi:hypothetical protein
MSSPTESRNPKKKAESPSRHKLPRKEDMQNALRLVEEVRKLSEEEQRYVFSELAKEQLDPDSDEVVQLWDNERNMLGYFEPMVHHFRESGRKFSGTAKSKEDILQGSVSVREFLDRVLQQRNVGE